MYIMKNTDTSDSSGSDNFEAFLNNIKTPKGGRYRYSSGSVSDFIVNTSDEEADPLEKPKTTLSDLFEKDRLEGPVFRIDTISSCSSSCSEKENELSDGNSKIRNQNFHDENSALSLTSVEDADDLCATTTKNDLKSDRNSMSDEQHNKTHIIPVLQPKDMNKKPTLKNERVKLLTKASNHFTPNKLLTRPHKSVTTPIRKVVFSSDSEDDVFHCSTAGLEYPKTPLRFSDSENECDFKVAPEKPKMILISSSEDDNDEPPSLAERLNSKSVPDKNNYKTNNSSSFKSLAGELENYKLNIEPNSSKLKILHPRGDSFSTYRTPERKPLKKHAYTEKVNKTRMHCSIKGCFLTSLDLMNQQNAGKGFQRNKIQLTEKLFKLFNSSVFENLLPQNMKVNWAKRLTKTAGITTCRRITQRKQHTDGDFIISRQYEASISLSDKVIDSACRLRDTLVHEMCHAAVWLVNNASESHGPFWKSWAAKARCVHPELPLVERCHNYDIQYKYVYQCTRCKTEIGRHSKSLDTTRKVCGRCHGKLELCPKTNHDGTPAKPRRANPFANFVKDNYKITRSRIESNGLPVSHRDIMKSLSEQFKSASLS